MQPIIIALVIIAFAVLFFVLYYFSDEVSIKRKFKKTPLQKIAYINEGQVAKIVGKVQLVDEPIIAPLSGRACAYYHIILEQLVSSGKSSHWKTIIDEHDICKFLIDDGSGDYAYFNSNHSKKLIVKDHEYKTSIFKDPSARMLQFLADRQIEPNSWMGLKKNLRCKEGILEPSESVALIGRGEWKKSEELELPSSYYRILHLVPTEEQVIYISDNSETTKKVDEGGIQRF